MHSSEYSEHIGESLKRKSTLSGLALVGSWIPGPVLLCMKENCGNTEYTADSGVR